MEKEWGREIQKSIPLSSACVHGRTYHKHITHTQKERETGGRASLRLSDYDPNTDIPSIQELHKHVFFFLCSIYNVQPPTPPLLTSFLSNIHQNRHWCVPNKGSHTTENKCSTLKLGWGVSDRAWKCKRKKNDISILGEDAGLLRWQRMWRA